MAIDYYGAMEVIVAPIKGVGPKKIKQIIDVYFDTAKTYYQYDILAAIQADDGRKALSVIKHEQRDGLLDNIVKFLEAKDARIGLLELLKNHSDIFKIINDNVAKDDDLKTVYRIIQSNPYAVINMVRRYTLKHADTVAIDIYGWGRLSAERQRAILIYVMKNAESKGHTYLSDDNLRYQLKMTFRGDVDDLDTFVDQVIESGKSDGVIMTMADKETWQLTNVAVRNLDLAEEVTQRSVECQSTGRYITRDEFNQMIIDAELPIKYDSSQLDAMFVAFNNQFMVLTGGPGTGKSTTVKGIVNMLTDWIFKSDRVTSLRHYGFNTNDVVLLAPTGRAASRMAEVIGLKASTIHSALGLRPGRTRTVSELDAKLVIVDEISMLDEYLFNELLFAIPENCRLVLVGDSDQLPSVSAGCVLRDLLDSSIVPRARLLKVHRQGKGSVIPFMAKAIRENSRKELDWFLNNGSQQHFFLETSDNEVTEKTFEMYKQAITTGGFDPNDVQVVSPYNYGSGSVNEINRRIQYYWNGKRNSSRSVSAGGYKIFVGDRVMVTVSDSSKRIVNGDIGYVKTIRQGIKPNIVCDFMLDGHTNTVELTSDEYKSMVLGYCVTVHKSQGGEFPCVIMATPAARGDSFNRNLLYTGVTRAKTYLLMIGNKNAYRKAITVDGLLRDTLLSKYIAEDAETLVDNVELFDDWSLFEFYTDMVEMSDGDYYDI